MFKWFWGVIQDDSIERICQDITHITVQVHNYLQPSNILRQKTTRVVPKLGIVATRGSISRLTVK
jgi:hypothetical protein